MDKGKDLVGRVIISQKIASTAPKAGKPKPNQVSTAVEFLAPRAREGRYRSETAGHFCLEEGLASARCCNSGSRSMASICSRLSAIGPGH